MFRLKYLVFILCYALTSSGLAQELDTVQTDQVIETFIEDYAETLDAEIDYTEFIEEFQFYLQNPMNINKPDYNVLRRVFRLSDYQVYQLRAYVKSSGELVTLYELNTIKGFDKQTIFRLLPYIKIETLDSPYYINWRNVVKFGRNQLFLRYQQVLEEQKGFSYISDSLLNINPNSRYLGSPQKLFARYNFNYRNRVRFGFTAEKDAGEEFFKGTQKNGFDFYSAHLFLRDFGVIKSLAIGDYHLQFGQGLTLWSGLAFGKSSSAMGIKKRAQGLRPYTSSDENNHMRGVATTVKLKNWELSLFYSKNNRDATVDTLDAEELYIASIQETGFHRTPKELSNKNAVNLELYGANLSFETEFSRIGLTYYQMEFDKELQTNKSLYNQFEFSGKRSSNLGLNYKTYFRKHSLFGEIAMSSNGGFAMINGLVTQLDPFFALSLLHRYYSVDYQNRFSVALGEGSRNSNEQGLYLGANMIFNSKLTMDAYVDLFSFKWLRYRVDAPSHGNEYFVQLNYTPARHSSIYFRYRQKNRAINVTDDIRLNRVFANEKQNFRIHFQHRLLRNLTIKNRLEWSSYQVEGKEQKNGFLIYQDAQYVFSKIPLTLSARYALFNTDSYDERIYAYESDVLYAFSIPAYFYRGTRTYLVMKYEITNNIDFWFRIAQTWYADRNVISSGLNEIQGNTKTDIKAQIRLKF